MVARLVVAVHRDTWALAGIGDSVEAERDAGVGDVVDMFVDWEGVCGDLLDRVGRYRGNGLLGRDRAAPRARWTPRALQQALWALRPVGLAGVELVAWLGAKHGAGPGAGIDIFDGDPLVEPDAPHEHEGGGDVHTEDAYWAVGVPVTG